MSNINGFNLKTISYNNIAIKKWVHDGIQVFNAGNIVTYILDNGSEGYIRTVEMDVGTDCLEIDFKPTKTGYVFVGWRTDHVASSNVLTSKIMKGEPITLYAIYKKTIEIDVYNGSANKSNISSGSIYYNAYGNESSISFVVPTQKVMSGWTAIGYSLSAGDADGKIIVSANKSYTTSDSVVLYGRYDKTVTINYYNNSATATIVSGTAHQNSLHVKYPSFILKQNNKDGWTKRGWSYETTANGTIVLSGENELLGSSDITLYGCYQKTITVSYYDTSTKNTATGIAYYNSVGNTMNPSITLAQSTVSGYIARGWSTNPATNATITVKNATATTFSADTTLYGSYQKTVAFKYYNNSTTTSSTTGIVYYSKYSNTTTGASFTVPNQASKSGWTARGWSTNGTEANANITHKSSSSITLISDLTLYGCYQKTVTASYNINGGTSGSTVSTNGIAYYNSVGNTMNPSITLASNGFTKSEAIFSKWAKGSASGATYSAGTTITLSDNTTFYAIWINNVYKLNVGDSNTNYLWHRETTPNNGWGEGNLSGNLTSSIVSFDCTNYKYCKVRVKGSIESTPSGATENYTWIRLGFKTYDSDANNVIKKWVGNTQGSGQVGCISSSDTTLGYTTWGDVILDISSLTGSQTLKMFCGGAYQNGGTLYVNTIKLYN